MIARLSNQPAEPMAGPGVVRVLRGGGRYLRGAEVNRHNQTWQPQQLAADAVVLDGWSTITSRARWLYDNDQTAGPAVDEFVRNAIGLGITTQSAAEIAGDVQEEFNAAFDALFEEWAENEADVESQLSWAEMQAVGLREAAITGECFFVEVFDDSRSIPLCYQMYEAEQLDRDLDRPAGKSDNANRIVGGVELDRANRAVAYHFIDPHPFDVWPTARTSRRVEASRVLHYFDKLRPSAHHGLSWMRRLIVPARDLDRLIANELTASNIAAMLVAAIYEKRAGAAGTGLAGADGDSSAQDDQGNTTLRLGAGTIYRGDENNKVDLLESKRPGPNFESFARLAMMLEANSVGLSYATLFGDFERVNYSSARMASIKDRRVYRPIQRHFGRRVCKAAHARAVQLAAGLRLLRGSAAPTPQDVARNPRAWCRCELRPPGFELTDMERETEAWKSQLGGGLATFADYYSQRGKNWRKELAQWARERRVLSEEFGISVASGLELTPRALAPEAVPAATPARQSVGTP